MLFELSGASATFISTYDAATDRWLLLIDYFKRINSKQSACTNQLNEWRGSLLQCMSRIKF